MPIIPSLSGDAANLPPGLCAALHAQRKQQKHMKVQEKSTRFTTFPLYFLFRHQLSCPASLVLCTTRGQFITSLPWLEWRVAYRQAPTCTTNRLSRSTTSPGHLAGRTPRPSALPRAELPDSCPPPSALSPQLPCHRDTRPRCPLRIGSARNLATSAPSCAMLPLSGPL